MNKIKEISDGGNSKKNKQSKIRKMNGKNSNQWPHQ